MELKEKISKMLIAEKTRLQGPNIEFTEASCKFMIEAISDQIKLITNQISSLIESNTVLNSRKETLKTISGIGDNSANQLLILLPELGTLNRKQIASLTGLDQGVMRAERIEDIVVL